MAMQAEVNCGFQSAATRSRLLNAGVLSSVRGICLGLHATVHLVHMDYMRMG